MHGRSLATYNQNYTEKYQGLRSSVWQLQASLQSYSRQSYKRDRREANERKMQQFATANMFTGQFITAKAQKDNENAACEYSKMCEKRKDSSSIHDGINKTKQVKNRIGRTRMAL